MLLEMQLQVHLLWLGLLPLERLLLETLYGILMRVGNKEMLNRDCERESQSRIVRKAGGRIDSEHHSPLLTPREVEYEASRCLGTISCEACDVCRMLCPDLAITRDRVAGAIVIDLAFCKGCGICASVCPKGAIEMVVEQAV